jgi:hypothetical protein
MGGQPHHGCDTQPERWVLKLKAAYEVGYYKTEEAQSTMMPLFLSAYCAMGCRGKLDEKPF